MNANAYVLLIVDTKTVAIKGVDIFGEEHPTMSSGLMYAKLLSVSGRNYAHALELAMQSIAGFPPLRRVWEHFNGPIAVPNG